MAEYDVKTIDYLPGRKRGPGSRKKFDQLIAEGWEVVSERHRLGAVTTATLRKPK
jgi:hypothetical protein